MVRLMRRKFAIKIEPLELYIEGAGKIAILLPHEMWSFMWMHNPEAARIRFLGGPGDLETFWAKTKANNDEWLQAHPCKEMVDLDPLHCVPIRLWGDDAPIGKHGRDLRCMSWCSSVCHLESLASKIAIYFGDTQFLTPAVEDIVMEVVAWSLNVMCTDVFPACDLRGNPWPAHSSRSKRVLSGETLTGTEGFRAIFVEIGGDQKWKKEVLRLQQSAQHTEICLDCKASKSAGPLKYANCAPDAPCFRPENRRKFQEYVAEQMNLFGNLPPITLVLGFHSGCIVDDFLHDDLLGIRQQLCASAMLELAERGIWGEFPEITRWRERLAAQLEVAYADFKKFCKESGFQSSQQRFKPASLSAATQTSWPLLKAKGHNCAIVSLFLMSTAEKTTDAKCQDHHSRV